MELDELMEDEQNVDEQRQGARTEAWESVVLRSLKTRRTAVFE